MQQTLQEKHNNQTHEQINTHKYETHTHTHTHTHRKATIHEEP